MKQEVILKQAPYGEASFEALRELGYAYVDKTPYIAVLEKYNTRFPFIIRPRRFGKSLFANMLMAYYDKAAKPEFKKNFEGTWIGEHPTPLASQFLVLKFDFSGIDDGDNLIQNFIENVKSGLRKFRTRYLQGDSEMEALLEASYASPAVLLSRALDLIENRFKEKIYLVIDEYDQFAQGILSDDPDQFREITSRQGFLKNFYTILKTQFQSVIGRAFITGVTSISLDSMTSGFNVATNITNVPNFAGMIGFTDEELRKLIPQVIDLNHCPVPADKIFSRMKELYDGYRFSTKSNVTVFNSSMCLYYLDYLSKNFEEPDVLLDPSFTPDLSKIEGILSLGSRNFVEKVVKDVLFDKPTRLETTLSSVINLQATDKLSDEDVLTVLVFMGFLTFAPNDKNRLICPNQAVKEQFFRFWFQRICRFKNPYLPAEDLKSAEKCLTAGNIRPLLDFVSAMLGRSAGAHIHAHLNETAIQLAALMAMSTSDTYQATAEEEALGAGFTDLVLRPREEHPEATGWLIEFKYVKAGKADAKGEAAVAEKLDEAVAQLERYSAAENIAAIPNLHRAAAVFAGTELRALKTF